MQSINALAACMYDQTYAYAIKCYFEQPDEPELKYDPWIWPAATAAEVAEAFPNQPEPAKVL